MTEDQDETSPSEEGSVPSGGDSPEPIPGEIPVPQVKDVPVEGVDGGAGVDFEELIEAIREDDDRYAMDAYRFVRESLDWQVSRLTVRRHISGPELLSGVQRLAFERFGPMARTVLNHWGLVDGEDVGRIVFQLIDAGILSKTEDDRLDDFAGVVRFDDLFEAGYRWP